MCIFGSLCILSGQNTGECKPKARNESEQNEIAYEFVLAASALFGLVQIV